MLNPQTVAELRALGDEDPLFFKLLLKTFLESLETRTPLISTAIDEQSSEKLSKGAHALKSSCYNLGALRLGELCDALEKIGRQGSIEGASTLYQSLLTEVQIVRQEVAALPEMKPNA